MTSTYLLQVTDRETGNPVNGGLAFGDLKVLAYNANVVKRALADSNADVEVSVVETDTASAGDAKRTVLSFSGDAETAALVLDTKIKRERAEAGAREPEPAEVPGQEELSLDGGEQA